MDVFSFNWRDIVDIALVTVLLYRIILLVRGTRAFSVLTGLVLLVVVYAVSQYVGLYTLTWLLENLFGSLFLVIVILFHDDIRQGLTTMGTHSLLWWRKRPTPTDMVGDLVWVCQYFAKRRIGALIVLENKVPLGDMMEGGVTLDAKLTRELILTIFFPNTALHDGAVIIRKGRIAAAGCILPLAQMDRQNFGTRHRAALGATEVSDATVIAVSEERGEVSVASRGHLSVMPDAEQLKETLNHVMEK
ncbi:MAG: diadenylate cyclase CdaA [Bilophila sp.]